MEKSKICVGKVYKVNKKHYDENNFNVGDLVRVRSIKNNKIIAENDSGDFLSYVNAESLSDYTPFFSKLKNLIN